MSRLADHILAKATALYQRGDTEIYLSVSPDFPEATENEFLDSVAELNHAHLILDLGALGPSGSRIVVTPQGVDHANDKLQELVKYYSEMVNPKS